MAIKAAEFIKTKIQGDYLIPRLALPAEEKVFIWVWGSDTHAT